MQQKLLTIFTPTYNRKELLYRLYKKLCEQENQNFIWLIVDDGSTDYTGKEVEKWQKEKIIEIEYYYKENHGLSSGYNKAIEHLHTEVAVCVDSDDYMEKYVTGIIQKYWERYGGDKNCAGLVGMVASPEGEVLCEQLRTGETYDFLRNKKMYGDKKIVVRSDLYKSVAPVLLYDDERGISPHILHMKICENYNFIQIGEVFCTVDYQATGMGRSMIKQYVESPKSFADSKEYALRKCHFTFWRTLKNAIHYDASCFIAGQVKIRLLKMPKKVFTWTLLPVGYVAAIVIRKKYNKKYGTRE